MSPRSSTLAHFLMLLKRSRYRCAPADCTAIIFGRFPGATQPNSSNSANAFTSRSIHYHRPWDKHASGYSHPSCSTSSYPIVFFPSIPERLLQRRNIEPPFPFFPPPTILPQSEIKPIHQRPFAPYIFASTIILRNGLTSFGHKNICFDSPQPPHTPASAPRSIPRRGHCQDFLIHSALAIVLPSAKPARLKLPVRIRSLLLQPPHLDIACSDHRRPSLSQRQPAFTFRQHGSYLHIPAPIPNQRIAQNSAHDSACPRAHLSHKRT